MTRYSKSPASAFAYRPVKSDLSDEESPASQNKFFKGRKSKKQKVIIDKNGSLKFKLLSNSPMKKKNVVRKQRKPKATKQSSENVAPKRKSKRSIKISSSSPVDSDTEKSSNDDEENSKGSIEQFSEPITEKRDSDVEQKEVNDKNDLNGNYMKN